MSIANRVRWICAGITFIVVSSADALETHRESVVDSIVAKIPKELCDETHELPFDRWRNILADKGDLLSACIDSGLSIKLVREPSYGGVVITPVTTKEVSLALELKDDRFSLGVLGSVAGSRLMYDRLCKQNGRLFRNMYGQEWCPIDGMSRISHSDAIEVLFNQSIGTSLLIPMVVNPLTIGPGSARGLRYDGQLNQALYLRSLEIAELSSEYVSLNGFLVDSDFRMYASDTEHLSLSDAIVTGSVVIVDSSAGDVTLEKLWIGGDLVLKGNDTSGLRFRDIRILGDIVIDENKLVSGPSEHPFWVKHLDTSGRVVVGSENFSSNEKVKKQFGGFRDELERWEAISHWRRQQLILD